MKKLGAQVRYVDDDTDGLIVAERSLTGAITGLLSSVWLTQSSLHQSREVGVQLDGADSVLFSQWLDLEWNNTRP